VIGTASAFMAGQKMLGDQFDGNESGLQYRLGEAAKGGFKPSPNAVYMPSLAQRPGDPLAYVPHDDPIGHIKKVCRLRRHGCEGAVNVPTPPPDKPPERIPLDEKFIQQTRKKWLKDDPALAMKNPREIRDAIIDKHAYKSGEE